MLPTYKDLAARFIWARERAQLTQLRLAELAGVSRETVSKIEAGEIKQPRKIMEFARILDVPPAWLQFGRPEIDKLSDRALRFALLFDQLETDDQHALERIAGITRKTLPKPEK